MLLPSFYGNETIHGAAALRLVVVEHGEYRLVIWVDYKCPPDLCDICAEYIFDLG